MSSYKRRRQLETMMGKMTRFLSSMVDDTDQEQHQQGKTYRFYYRCLPPSGERLHQYHPIRDLAAAWDATKALQFWSDNDQQSKEAGDCVYPSRHDLTVLERAVYHTLQYYDEACVPIPRENGSNGGTTSRPCGLILNPTVLQEPSNIAHSAVMILASLGALHLPGLPDDNNDNQNLKDLTTIDINGLAQGILYMQRENGAFQTQFNHEGVYHGIDFYPGEAMLALMDVYQLSCSTSLSPKNNIVLDPMTRNAILPSMERALEFYSNYYYESHPDTNYNIWQVQAFSKLFHFLHTENTNANNGSKEKAATYIIQMCQDIVNSKSWKYELARGRPFYPNLSTVEIACGLDSLVDGIQVVTTALSHNNNRRDGAHERLRLFWRNTENAVDFLDWSLDQAPADMATIGSGGLGYGGIQVMEQRLDVTGHAMSSFSKLHRLLLEGSQ